MFNHLGFSIVQNESLKTLSGKEFPFSPKMVPREENQFSHRLVHGYPNVPLKAYEINCNDEDISIATRLLNSYHKAFKDEEKLLNKPQKDVWEYLQKVKHKDYVQLLGEKDPKALARYLCNKSKQHITHGMTQGKDAYEGIISDKNLRSYLVRLYMDKLVSLAEALGCLPFENPEAGQWGQNLYTNIDDLVSMIEEKIGIDITPPKISGGLFGIASKKGLFHFREINSIYTAWRIREIVKRDKNPTICEIGAGAGRNPYYCYKMGIKNIAIIDLPYVCTISAYYLIKSLPKANIVLYGEAYSGNPNAIKIFPYWCFKDFPDNTFDLTFNQDSFPEIEYETVLNYLKKIKRNTRGFFLSINHEGQAPSTEPGKSLLVVPQLINTFGDDFERIYRFRYWLREGFIEELYKITN